MTWNQYWNRNDLDGDPFAGYTYGEEIWKAARKDLLKEQRRRKKKTDSSIAAPASQSGCRLREGTAN